MTIEQIDDAIGRLLADVERLRKDRARNAPLIAARLASVQRLTAVENAR